MTLDPSRLAAICWCDRYKAAGGGRCEPCQLADLKAELARLQAEHTELRRSRVGDAEIIGREMSRAEKAEADVVRLQAERDEARADAGELVAIKTLVSDRSEVGTYAKVDAIIADLEAAEAARDEAQRSAAGLRAALETVKSALACPPAIETHWGDISQIVSDALLAAGTETP